MIVKFLNLIAKKLGRENYSFDIQITSYSFAILIFSSFINLVRFYMYKPFLKKSGFIGFISRRVTIKYGHKVRLGRSAFIGPDVLINALSGNGICIGNNFTIKAKSIIDCTGVYSNIGDGIEIGDNVGISENCFIQVRGKIIIGDNVIIGPSVKIFSENHLFEDSTKLIRNQGVKRKGVVIDEGAWIGSSAVILDGVHIGKNSIIAAGSVVTKNVDEFSIYAGNPAKFLKKI